MIDRIAQFWLPRALRARVPYARLVLGLAPWYGTIFLFLEQIAPSPAEHARTLLRGFSRMSRRGNGVRNSRLCFWPSTQRLYLFMAVGTLLSIFPVSCSSLYVCMYGCISLFKHGKSSVKLKLKTKTNYNCFTWLPCGNPIYQLPSWYFA